METPGEPKRTPPRAWTPNYLKGTSSHQSRVTAPTAKAKENIDAVDLFTRHDEKRTGRFTVPNGVTTPPRSRAPTPPPATSHFAVSTKPIEELEPLDDSWGASMLSRTAMFSIVLKFTNNVQLRYESPPSIRSHGDELEYVQAVCVYSLADGIPVIECYVCAADPQLHAAFARMWLTRTSVCSQIEYEYLFA